jgi:phospholipase C
MALADIDTIVVVIMENRSFDHMLGYLRPGKARAIQGRVGLYVKNNSCLLQYLGPQLALII